MAIEEEEEELELDVNQPKGSKMITILLIVLIVLILAIGGVGAWFLLGSEGDDAGDNDNDRDSVSADTTEETEKVLTSLKYLTLVPEFVVNFGPGSKVRYLQVDLQIATRDEASLETVSIYRPVLRNDILVILSGLSYEELKDRSGKEALQKKILNTINKVVVSASHVAPVEGSEEVEENSEYATQNENVEGPIENVYFTSFIMQ